MHGTLTFTRSADVVPDEERPGLLRARPVWDDEDGGDVRRCELRDLTSPETTEPGLEDAGFQTIDLSGNPALQEILSAVHDADQLSDTTAEAIREALTDARFDLGDGQSLQIDHVVEDGLFHRRSGPDGLDVNPAGIVGINGHGGAQYVHGDQDVFGTPLRQLMHGAAPETFRHLTPDGRNDDASTFLLNLWIPLHAPVQPLALMDRRTLDASRHQLRYGLPVDGFLEREEEAGVNDIWSFLYDEGQEWYFRSDMGPDQGYVFDTLGTPHGATALAGEDALAELYVLLNGACEGHSSIDQPDLRPPVGATATIHAMWSQMSELLQQAADTAAWAAESRAAMHAVIRRSVEMRLVATLATD